ncbi:MAG: NAD-dependent epimerase/dehydratase family protein [Proteobacteria bacterium]|nr:NAD-dependent epimerase/dehydratase family protein [Pseudomonadota bacterium]
MSRVLVTGASGFIGRVLAPALSKAGHRVLAATRTPEAARDLGETHAISDLGPDTPWRDALDGVDQVIHLAARVHVMKESAPDPLSEYRRVNTDGTRRLAEEAAAAGVRRIVFFSTVKVNGEASAGVPFRETDSPRPGDAYAQSKWEAEQALFEVAERTGLEAVVLRPPLVYGAGVKGHFLTLLKVCRAAPPLPFGALANSRSLIYAGNLADAAIRCLEHPGAQGKVYLVRDGDDVSTPELIRRVSAALGRTARLFPVPRSLLRLAGACTGNRERLSRLLDSLTLDDGRIREELGWTPPFTMVQGLHETARWFASGPTEET